MKNIIKIVLAVLFLICLLKMPYGYYQVVRFFGMLGFIYLGIVDKEEKSPLQYIWFTSAILINPFIKVNLGRELWNVADIIWAAFLIATIFKDRKREL